VSDRTTRTVAGWRIYYADGSVVQSQDDIEWEDAPAEAVAAVIIFYEETFTETEKGRSITLPYRHIFEKEDYYWQVGANRSIVAGSKEDLNFDAAKHGVRGIKRGLIPDSQVFERVHNDRVF
jgi:hypothetical protein